MSHFPFGMPDEVIFELMDDDAMDRNAEYHGNGSSAWERGEEFRHDHQVDFTPRVTCKRCGAKNLEWRKTKFGLRLLYKTGWLAGKIHGCAE